MKRAELRELRGLTIPELQKKARETKEELFNLRFALRTGHLSDFSKVRAMRKNYAQILTALTEKRLSEETHGAA